MANNPIIIYLCNKKIQGLGLSIETNSGDSSIEASMNEDGESAVVNLKLKHIPADGIDDCTGQTSRTIEVPLIASGQDIIPCVFPFPDKGLTWERGVTEDNNGAVTGIDNFITITFTNPQGECINCFWWETVVFPKFPYTPTPRYPFLISTGRKWFVGTPGEVPAYDSDKEDYIQGPVALTQYMEEHNPSFLPGEQLSLWWSFKENDEISTYQINNTFFRSPLFTGGKIIAKNEGVNSVTDLTWDVEVEGVIISGIIPTDFADYEIDSWVFLMMNDGDSNIVERKSLFNSSNGISGDLRLLPVDLGGSDTKVSGSFETKDYRFETDFEEVYEYSYCTGKILDIVNKKANVTITLKNGDGEEVEIDKNGVSIFYHCPNSSTIDNGYTAFAKDDEVILLNECISGIPSVADLSVIGFTDKLKSCGSYVLIESYAMGFIWDPISNKFATDIPENDSSGNLTGNLITTWPCSKNNYVVWKASKTESSEQLYSTRTCRIDSHTDMKSFYEVNNLLEFVITTNTIDEQYISTKTSSGSYSGSDSNECPDNNGIIAGDNTMEYGYNEQYIQGANFGALYSWTKEVESNYIYLNSSVYTANNGVFPDRSLFNKASTNYSLEEFTIPQPMVLGASLTGIAKLESISTNYEYKSCFTKEELNITIEDITAYSKSYLSYAVGNDNYANSSSERYIPGIESVQGRYDEHIIVQHSHRSKGSIQKWESKCARVEQLFGAGRDPINCEMNSEDYDLATGSLAVYDGVRLMEDYYSFQYFLPWTYDYTKINPIFVTITITDVDEGKHFATCKWHEDSSKVNPFKEPENSGFSSAVEDLLDQTGGIGIGIGIYK